MGKQSNTLVYVTECIQAGELISKQLQISADTKVWRVVRAREIDGERIILDIGQDTHVVVVVRGYVHLEDTTLFQYTESRHRLDKFQFVDFARRESTLSF